jgi:hypothetical protein
LDEVRAQPKFAKYKMMIKMLPEGAVKQKMQMNGIGDADIAEFFGEGKKGGAGGGGGGLKAQIAAGKKLREAREAKEAAAKGAGGEGWWRWWWRWWWWCSGAGDGVVLV